MESTLPPDLAMRERAGQGRAGAIGLVAVLVAAIGISLAETDRADAAKRVTKVACVAGTGSEFRFVARKRPRRCDLLSYGTGGPGAHNTYVLRKITWRRWGGKRAVGRATFVPSHGPRARVTLTLSGRSARYCAPGLASYDKFRIAGKGLDFSLATYRAPGCEYD
jgi:hypothetical protein